MPTDKYTRIILTVIACGLLALVVQNAMGPSDMQVAPSATAPNTAPSNTAPSNTAPSNTESRLFKKIQFCDSEGCIEMFNVKLENLSGACAQVLGDRPTTTGP